MNSPRPHHQEPLAWIAPDLARADDAALVAALLDHAAGAEIAPRQISERQYSALAAHRILALVPSSWTTPPATNLRADRHALAAQQLAIMAEAIRVVATLESASIDHRVLKGTASSFLDYANPNLRTFGDIDLLVRPEQFDRTRELLASKLDATTPDPGRYGYRFQIEATMDLPSGTEVDVHHRLSPFARPLDSAFDDGELLPELGAQALPLELRLCHAALHVIGTPPGQRRLSGLADIATIRSHHAVDLAAVRKWAQQLGAEALVGLALAIERTVRELVVDTEDWAAPTFLERHSFAQSERRIFFEQMHRMRQLTGVQDRVAFVLSGMVPSPSQVDHRGGFAEYYGRLIPGRLTRPRE